MEIQILEVLEEMVLEEEIALIIENEIVPQED